MRTLQLTAALYDCDLFRDLTSGIVRPKGINILPLLGYRPHEIFYRFMHYQEWEITELSFAYFCSMIADGDDRAVGLPVFPVRQFRQSSIFVHVDGHVRTPKDLYGKRVGIAEWGVTAGVYVRGWLVEQLGIPLDAITWIQGGVNEPGRTEKFAHALPEGVQLTIEADRSLTEMLLSGDLDAIFCAAAPAAMQNGDKRIVRLIPDPRPAEEAYFRETGIYPIMHIVAVRSDVYRHNRWVASSLYDAFDEARRRSVKRVTAFGSQIPIPWCYEEARRIGSYMFPDGEYWPYGLEPNRLTIEAFLRFCYAQGICRRQISPEELFAPETLGAPRE